MAFEVLGEHHVDLRLGRDDPVSVARHHRQHAAGEVAVVVGELGLVAGLEAGGGNRAVLAEADLAEEVEAQRVGAEAVDHLERIEHVAEALRHLFLAHQQVAVDHHAVRRLQPGGHAEGGPDDGVELEDVLRHHVQVGGPVAVGEVLALAGEGERGDVVEECVEPDVHALALVPGS